MAKATCNNSGSKATRERFVMQILYSSNGERKKYPHHKDVLIPKGVEITIPEKMSGCPEQRIVNSKPKSVRFKTEKVDLEKFEVWSVAVSPRRFFKVSIRLTEPYVYHLKEIQDEIACTFLNLPRGMARGTNLDDVPGNITSKSIIGMENYIIKSRRTHETIELFGVEEEARKKRHTNVFDYWVFDQKMLEEGFVLTVGNEEGTQFIRKLEIGSLPKGKDIVTAYVRPWICESMA